MVAIKDIKKTELMWPYNIGCEHITFINVVHYMEARYGEDYYFNFMTRPSYEKTSKELMEWCEENDVHYYGESRENFYFTNAGEEAIKAGKKVVLFEDFS
tara:strand:+ start:226 stop:525 length:300 start_codon:yes stop_codon:yes gene_type:complete